MKHYDARTYTVAESVGFLLRRGAALLRQALETEFEGHGLTFVHWATLMRLRDNPSLTAGDICRDLMHDSGAFTRVLDHLEERGLVRRERSESDRRVVRLHLTTAGRHEVQKLVPIVVDQLNHALQDFSAAEVVTFGKMLRRMISRLEADGAPCATPQRKIARP